VALAATERRLGRNPIGVLERRRVAIMCRPPMGPACPIPPDVEAFHDRAVNAGAEILKPPTDEPWGMREFGVRSPDGHRFMLGQPAPS